MTTPGSFPGIERFAGGSPQALPYTVVAMFTPGYARLAERLRGSLQRHGQHYAIYEVPQVHRSISPKGVDDLALSKAALIRHGWQAHGRPLLYVDCDMVMRRPPTRLLELCRRGREFAVYNWLADEATDCFEPVSVAGIPDGRMYRFTRAIDLYGPEQLTSSGCAQFWAYAPASSGLLERWLKAQSRFPGASDDHCLDFAYNQADGEPLPAHAWFDKAYARYPWWPHVEPTLDHPDTASTHRFEPIPPEACFHKPGLEVRRVPLAIPRDCVVDIVTRRIYRVRATGPASSELVAAGSVDVTFFPTG